MQSQPSSDPEYLKIEKSAFDLEDSGKYEQANTIYSQLLDHPSLTCKTEGRNYKFIAYNQARLEQREKSLNTLITKVFPIWENCDSLPKRYLVSPYNKVAGRYLVLKKPEKALEYAHKVINLYNTGNGVEYEYYRLAEAQRYIASAHSMLGNSYLSYKYLQAADYVNTNFVKPKRNKITKFRNLQEKIRLQFEDEAYEEALLTVEIAQEYVRDSSIGYNPSKNQLFALHANKLKTLLNLNRLDDAKKELEYLSDNLSHIKTVDTKTQYYQLSAQYNSLIGNQQAAIDSLSIAIDLASQISDMSNKAMNKLNLAQVYHRSKNESLTDDYISKAIGDMTELNSLNILSEKIDLKNKTVINYDDLFYILTAYYDIKIELYEKSNKVIYLNDAIAVFDEIDYLVKSSRNTYQSEYSQLSHIEKIYGMYEQMISFLVLQDDQKYKVKALEYCMNNKSTILANEERKKRKENIVISEANRAIVINQESTIRNLEQEYLTSAKSERDSLNILYLKKLTENYMFAQSLSSDSKESTNTSKKVDYVKVVDLSKKLSSEESLLEIYFGKKVCYIFLLTDAEVQVHEALLTQNIKSTLEAAIENLINEGSVTELKQNSSKIFNTFFEPLLSNSSVKNIITIPDGLFHDLPLGSLWNGSNYLIQDYDISNLNSAQELLNESTRTDLSYTGYGTSYTTNLNNKLSTNYSLNNIRLSTLENAESEIKTGNDLFNGQSFIGSKSSLSSFTNSENEISGILHFALHGLILDEYNSAILFDDRSDNFLLTSNEVYNMELNNYLSILSACYSADGKIYAGEGVRSLARAFAAAGSENIVSSLWAASDQANTKIMASFFQGVNNGESLTHALSEAKRLYISSAPPAMQHPSNWANMVLIGKGENNPSKFPIWAMGLLALAILGGGILFSKKNK